MPLVESTDLRFVARAAVPSAGAATIAAICGATAFGGSKSSGKTPFFLEGLTHRVASTPRVATSKHPLFCYLSCLLASMKARLLTG